jgi:hypothetical protein
MKNFIKWKRPFELSISIILIAIPNFLSAQNTNLDSSAYQKSLFTKPTEVICDRPQTTACNQIENNIFSSTCYGTDPFWTNCISKWNSLHGSPQLNVFGPVISPTVNHASMWASSQVYTGFPPNSEGEGIITGIPKLTPGKKYAFSILKRYFSSQEYPTVDLDKFYIVLMKCADYLPMRSQYPIIPDIPVTAQIIYCESDMSNHSFQRILGCFTANDEYDIVWIFPKQNTFITGYTFQSWLEVAKFEIIKTEDFSAGISPNPLYPNCNVTLGPTIPNCGFQDAVFTYYGPSGQVIPAPANQQIQVDASNLSNVGSWTLKMTVANTVTTNNTCSQSCNIQATVIVPSCQNSCATISANSTLDKCWCYDCGDFATLTTNLTSNIQWYNNGNAIPGANGQTYVIHNNPGPSWPTSTGTYSVRNTMTNCTSELVNVTRRNWSAPNPNNTIVNYCKSRLGNLQQHPSITDPNSIYSWQILDPFGNDVTGMSVIIGTNNTSNNNTTISFSNYPYSTATIIAKALDNGCFNSAQGYQVNIYPDPCPFNLIESKTNRTNLIKESVQIFPNPANNQIKLISTESINTIEIVSLLNTYTKIIKLRGFKFAIININDLKPGIYNVKITTEKGIENKKLIIQR